VASDAILDELERSIHEQLAYHRQQYQRAIEPLAKQLSELYQCRPQRLAIPLADAIAAGLIPKRD
jgi:hypothetical protein